MTTAIDLIQSAAGLVGALGTGEILNASEATDGLVALNEMLASWSTDRMFVYQIAKAQYTWGAGAASKTVGITGDIAIIRPVKVEDSYLNTADGQSYVLRSITRTGYDFIGLKTLQTNIPEWLYYDPGFPLGTLYLYPVPGASITLFLNYWLALPAFTALTDVVTLPPGYARAIRYNLAIDLAPYFGMRVPPEVAAIANAAALKIKRLNSPDIPVMLEVAHSPRLYNFNIFRGY